MYFGNLGLNVLFFPLFFHFVSSKDERESFNQVQPNIRIINPFNEIMMTKYCKMINNNLFGEIGKFKKFAKISHKIKRSQSLDILVLGISKLILRQMAIFEKPPNIIATKYSRFTVNSIKKKHISIAYRLI